jgi:subtilase family serine protease
MQGARSVRDARAGAWSPRCSFYISSPTAFDKESIVNQCSLRRAVTALLALLAVFPATAAASTTAQGWEEIGGSASGLGISASKLGVVPEHRNASIVIDADGRPVVAYTDWADIVVRRWNGLEWEIIAQPGGGHLPQLVQDATGRIYLGWMQFVPDTSSWEVYLLVRDPATGDWTEIGGSATGGGISGADGRANVNSFSLALGPDGTPWVAYDTTPTAGTDFTTAASGIALDSQQIYVKHWTGPTDGWTYVGSGRTGGGATSVPSFVFTNGNGTANFALHGALSPALAVRGNGSPVLAFVYTNDFQNGNPPGFNGINDDIYAVTWTGGAWVPMGPAVPATAAGAGLGGPGGISNDGGWSVEGFINRLNRPYVIIARDGAPVLGWGETSDIDALRRMYVRRWNGTAWQGLGSATGELARSSAVFDISLAPGLNGPIAAWAGGGGLDSSIFVRAFDSTTGHWNEVGIGSGTGTGISGGAKRDHTPWVTVDAAGVPSVAWIEAPNIESSGQTFVRTFDPRSLADLQVTALTAPTTTRTGGTIAVANTVRNVGPQPSPSVPLTFYLSTGTTRGPGDVMLGSRSVAAMAAGGTNAATTMLTLPASVEPGTYRVLAVVDEANTAVERNESNNVGVSAAMSVVLFRPELAFTTFSVPTVGATGKTLAITNTVRNSGVAPATAFTVRFYLSSDDTLDSGDTLLGARTITSLAAGASSPAVTTVMIPAATSAPAAYRVIGVVDADNQQTELDEANNTAVSSPVTITLYRPDLMTTALTMPATGATGRPLAITSTVRNAGPAPATAFTVRFYLSADGTLDAGDVLLGSRMLTSLAAGASSTAVTTVTIPANTSAPASYRIIAVADALDQQVETAEANNTLVSSTVVEISLYRPDLMLTALNVPASVAAGRPLAITHTVRNAGPAPATAFTVHFYLSADATLDSGDVLLGSRTLTSLAAGANSSAVTTVTIPANTPVPSTYRIIAVVDALGQQTETQEGNNVMATSAPMTVIAYLPDLRVTALSVPAGATAGRMLTITHTVANFGPAPAGLFTVRFYLSADGTFDASDVLLGARALPSLAPGPGNSVITTVIVPAGTVVPDPYRVIAVVDAFGQQAEVDESNNITVSDPRAAGPATASAH